MRIGIVLIAWGFYGEEKFVHNFCKYLIKRGIQTNLIVNEEVKNFYKDIPNLKIISLGRLSKNIIGKFFIFLRMQSKLTSILNKEKLDILNIQSGLPSIIYKKINYKKNCPILITFHGSDMNNFIYPQGIIEKFILNKLIEDRIILSKNLISVSKEQIAYFPEKYKKKTVAIPNGVDSNLFKPLKNIKQRANVILFVGRFVDIKGIQEIVNVAKQLPEYEFWFAGSGQLSNLINLKNTKNLGFKKNEELVKLYNQSTICIFPSHREGFGLVGLEAMACGRAVIATPLGFSEYIENGKDGIIIPAKDEVALKNAIADLMTNEKKRKMLEKNTRKKALQYSWDNVVQRYLEVYKKVIRGERNEQT